MQRLSRVGRKAAMKRVLYQEYKRKGLTAMTVGQIAKRMGGKSSSNLKRMLKEMIENDDNICDAGYENEFRVMWIPYQQQPLPDRWITINGQKQKLANWVLDTREIGQNA